MCKNDIYTELQKWTAQAYFGIEEGLHRSDLWKTNAIYRKHIHVPVPFWEHS